MPHIMATKRAAITWRESVLTLCLHTGVLCTGPLTHDSISPVCSFCVLKIMPETGAVQIVKSCTCAVRGLKYQPRLLDDDDDDEDWDKTVSATAARLTMANKFGSSSTACAEENVSSLLLLFLYCFCLWQLIGCFSVYVIRSHGYVYFGHKKHCST